MEILFHFRHTEDPKRLLHVHWPKLNGVGLPAEPNELRLDEGIPRDPDGFREICDKTY